MKITCAVEVTNRALKEENSRYKVNYKVATLALCHKARSKEQSDKNVVLIMCTHKNPRGTKYKIHSNVAKLFTKYLNDGRCTVKFKEPPHDINITGADPLQLKGFLHGIGLTIVGQGTGKIHFSPAPTKVDRPEKKLTVSKAKDLRSSFPQNLTWLQVNTGSLKKINNNILKLKYLQVLDLKNNSLKELPLALADMRLKELLVGNNELVEFPKELSTGALGQTLKVLDLSCNQISRISPYFCLMKNLTVLSLKCNKLQAFPRNMHCLESLKTLGAAHNELKALPFGIRKLSLDTLDLFHNPLNTDVDLRPVTLWKIPTLKDCAAAAIVTQKVPYSAEDLPLSLLDYLVEHCLCPCSQKVFQKKSSSILVLDLQKLASSVAYINNSSRFKVPLEVYFCSSKCWCKFYSFTAKKNNLNAA